MIKTRIESREDALNLLQLGKELHQESRFNNTEYDESRVMAVFEATIKFPEKYFIAYDDQFHGLILLQLTHRFFSGEPWVGDLAFYVTPKYRGTRLSMKLLNAGAHWAKEVGATELAILYNTGIQSERNKEFFNHIGYETTGHIFTKKV